MARYKIEAKVLSQIRLNEDTFMIKVLAPDIASAAKPGQFCMVGTMPQHLYDPLLNRPLSIFDVESDGAISFLYKVVGRSTSILASKCFGASLYIVGPLGRGFSVKEGKAGLLVGGGMGVAPLYFLSKIYKWKQPMVMLMGLPTYKGFESLVDIFKKVSEQLWVSTDDGSFGHKGLVTELLEQGLSYLHKQSSKAQPVIYCCGPWPMMKAVSAWAEKMNIECQVSLEARMACGTGLCLGCAVPKTQKGYLHVCKEGPVFDAKKVKW